MVDDKQLETEFPKKKTYIFQNDEFALEEFHIEKDFYDPDDIKNWFKRCMNDFPFLSRYDYLEDVLDALEVLRDRSKWFHKWFSQFVEDVS